MKLSKIIILVLLLSGCDCDSICQANRATNAILDNYKTHSEVAKYLNEYIGEAPGAERFNVFVNWGVSNPEEFVAMMNSPEISDKVLDIVIYKISDMGQSEKYCEIYRQRKERTNDKVIRSGLLGCQYSL